MLRAVDRLVALAGLVLAAPLLLLIAVSVKTDSRGPVLHRQLRVGKDRRNGTSPTDGEAGRRTGDLGGRPFVLYKFRTMHVDAEEDSGPTWSSSEDDRTTGVGGFLRRHRLDELPQLWNVLKGDMAVVGPRPERPAIFQRLREQIDGYGRRQAVRPGITGWAQINRPKDQSVDDVERKLRYDLDYVEHRSLGVDLWIMLKTPLVMLDPDLVEEARPAGGNGIGTFPPRRPGERTARPRSTGGWG
jgi:lipopolysaccharide/colanic/teichoic acid biosynthesis glycosyltransferase